MKNIELVENFIKDNFFFSNDVQFNMETDLFEKRILDSTGVIELVSFIEQNFNLVVEDEELVLDNFSSLNSIESFLVKKKVISAE